MSSIIVVDYDRGRKKVVITVEIYKQIRKMRLQGEYSGQFYTPVPETGNRRSDMKETVIPL